MTDLEMARSFTDLCQRSLHRVARHTGVQWGLGEYDEVFRALRGSQGQFEDLHGTVEYRFHGFGCELVTAEGTCDFNFYPKVNGKSPIWIDPWKHAQYLQSKGIEVDHSELRRRLQELHDRGLLERGPGAWGNFRVGDVH